MHSAYDYAILIDSTISQRRAEAERDRLARAVQPDRPAVAARMVRLLVEHLMPGGGQPLARRELGAG